MSTIQRVVLIAIGLTLAAPTLAADKKKQDSSAAKAKKEKQPATDPKLIDEVAAARSLFVSRVDMCSPPQKCDAETMTVVDDAEKRFVTACAACASEKKCEEDRAQIRGGKGPRHFNPCG
jgi:hypothetical protein